jgi:hypothetical protein
LDEPQKDGELVLPGVKPPKPKPVLPDDDEKQAIT